MTNLKSNRHNETMLRTPLLPQANQRVKNRDYLNALHIYSELVKSIPEIHSSITWNISYCCRKLLESHESDGTISGSEYFQWIIKAIQATNEPSLASSLEIVSISSQDLHSCKLISVIMPTWNRENTIKSAIRSVQSQTYQNWELLICDDGSTDNTETIVKQLNDRRIHYFKLPKGNGAIARNYGLRHAKGEIITFLDSDNLWSPSFLAVVQSQMGDPDLQILYTAFTDITIEDDQIIGANLHFKEFDYERLAFRNYIDLNTLSFRSNLLELFGYFDPRLPRQQDWDLLMRYACRANVRGVNKPLVCYFRNNSLNQVTKTMQSIDTRSWIMKKNKSLIDRIKVNNKTSTPLVSTRIFSIKISAPNQEEGRSWGDYHFAHSLGKCLASLGWSYRVDCQDTWYAEPSDAALVLRGRHRYHPEKTNNKVCIQWIISHPNRLKESELADYDHILVASSIFCKKLQAAIGTPITTLYQACVETIDKQDYNKNPRGEIVFVASSRKQKRDMVEWCYDAKLPLDLYGTGWEEDPKAQALLKGAYIANDELIDVYQSYKIVLNDHWPDMKSNGFISNRIFDACGAGSLVITDRVLGIEEVFGDNVVIAENMQELSQRVKYLLDNENIRREKALNAKEIVLTSHTFRHRAETISAIVNQYLQQYAGGSK